MQIWQPTKLWVRRGGVFIQYRNRTLRGTLTYLGKSQFERLEITANNLNVKL